MFPPGRNGVILLPLLVAFFHLLLVFLRLKDTTTNVEKYC